MWACTTSSTLCHSLRMPLLDCSLPRTCPLARSDSAHGSLATNRAFLPVPRLATFRLPSCQHCWLPGAHSCSLCGRQRCSYSTRPPAISCATFASLPSSILPATFGQGYKTCYASLLALPSRHYHPRHRTGCKFLFATESEGYFITVCRMRSQ